MGLYEDGGPAGALLTTLAAEVGDGPELDDLLESLGQMARGEGRVVRPVELEEVDDMRQDRC